MTLRLFGICVISFSGWWCLSAASESHGEDFVRIEVRGKLDQWTFNPGERNQYAVLVQHKKGQQPFLLDLPDDATQKAARQLVGQVVIVTGDGVRGGVVGDGKRKQSTREVTWITVKSLKKVEIRGDEGPAKEPAPLEADLKKLQGTWVPAKPVEKAGYLRLEFDKALKDGKDYLAVIHAVPREGKMLDVGDAVVKFALKEDGKKRVISPLTRSEGVSDIAYRFEGDTLVVEEGECTIHYKVALKGQWKRFKGEKLP